ncbi:MAG: hypothetical protein AABX86_02500 [Nanoarchaeota archaeon]
MGIFKGIVVILILIFLLLFIFYPEETKAMVKTVGNVILDFGKERTEDMQETFSDAFSQQSGS